MLKNNFRPGDLIKIIRSDDGWTLVKTIDYGISAGGLREMPVDKMPAAGGYGGTEYYNSVENKLALILEVIVNRLDQPTGYRILMTGDTWFCKSIMAEKYFEKVGE
jgi:hypothetical protein